MIGDDEVEKGVARCTNCGNISPIEITPDEEMRPLGMQGRSCCDDTSYRLLTVDESSEAFADD